VTDRNRIDRSWVVEPEDERTHPRGPEPLWNESWYFDFVADDGEFGGYVRVGLVPNQGTAWVLVAFTGPDLPAVMIDDQAAPLPAEGADPNTVTDRYRLELQVLEDLTAWRVHGDGTARRDPTSADEPAGSDVEIDFDLTWTTDGTPYRYPIGARYEIPCVVDGSVTIDGRRRQITAAVGQRDHSWGERDWEAMSWCWSAARLADGARAHLTQLQIGDATVTVGYTQADGSLLPVTEATVDIAGDLDHPDGTALVLGPDGEQLSVVPVAFASTAVITRDGSKRAFPRAMASFTPPAGDPGWGWIEWNHPG